VVQEVIVKKLLDRYGYRYAEQAGIRLADRPGPLYQLLVLATLLSARISAHTAVAAARELSAAGYRSPGDAVCRQKTGVGDGSAPAFSRYKESGVSLPAAQQRVLDRMEGALLASEPHLAATFAIFTRLSADEPVGAEPLARGRRRHRWLQRGTALHGFVLVPVMFMMIVIGALLSSRAHSTGTCEAGYAAGIGSPWVSPPLCQVAGSRETVISGPAWRPAPSGSRPSASSPGPAATRPEPLRAAVSNSLLGG
jgi:Protein of unknown function (DUF3040)